MSLARQALKSDIGSQINCHVCSLSVRNHIEIFRLWAMQHGKVPAWQSF